MEWIVGSRDDGTDSVARQIATEHDWPNLHVLILVVCTVLRLFLHKVQFSVNCDLKLCTCVNFLFQIIGFSL